MTHTPNYWPAALVAAFLFLGIGAAMDGPSDTQDAQAQTEWVNDAKRLAEIDTEQERTVTRVCRSLHGERAVVLQTTDGDWVCRRGE